MDVPFDRNDDEIEDISDNESEEEPEDELEDNLESNVDSTSNHVSSIVNPLNNKELDTIIIEEEFTKQFFNLESEKYIDFKNKSQYINEFINDDNQIVSTFSTLSFGFETDYVDSELEEYGMLKKKKNNPLDYLNQSNSSEQFYNCKIDSSTIRTKERHLTGKKNSFSI